MIFFEQSTILYLKEINKTPEQIAEVQEAVEYLNELFNGDLSFVKKAVFPELWKFGLAHSNLDSAFPGHSALFGLYPQKGET